MKSKWHKIFLISTVLLCFFWDILDGLIGNLPLAIMALLLVLYIIIYREIAYSKKIMIIMFALLAHGFLNIALGNTTIGGFLTQYVAILVSIVFFYNVLRENTVDIFFQTYLKAAIVMSYIAIIQEIIGVFHLDTFSSVPVLGWLSKNYGSMLFLVKVHGLYREPSFLAYFLCPAMFLSLAQFFCSENIPRKINKILCKRNCIFILAAYILTFSLTGYIGLAFAAFLIWYHKGVSLTKIVMPILMIFVVILCYTNIPDIKVRIDSVLAMFASGRSNSLINYGSMNLSSFTYYSNFRVMISSLPYTHFLGAGLGGTSKMYDLFNIGGWSANNLMLNREDANSMLFRIVIELGIPGFVLLIVFLIKGIQNRKKTMFAFSSACFCLIFVILLRQGNYTHGGALVFFCAFYILGKKKKLNTEEVAKK